MPTYELAVVLRQMAKPELISTLKRTATAILEKGGIIRKIENLGTQPLPFKISVHNQIYREGSFFTMEFDTAPKNIADLDEEYGRDIDIVRRFILKVEESPEIECTLHEELLPPMYRKDVQEMLRIGQRKEKKKFKYNSGLDYYPFQK